MEIYLLISSTTILIISCVFLIVSVRRLRKIEKVQKTVQSSIVHMSQEIDGIKELFQNVTVTVDEKEKRAKAIQEAAAHNVEHLKLLISSLHDLPGYQRVRE